jgi:hypothetical protein
MTRRQWRFRSGFRQGIALRALEADLAMGGKRREHPTLTPEKPMGTRIAIWCLDDRGERIETAHRHAGERVQ